MGWRSVSRDGFIEVPSLKRSYTYTYGVADACQLGKACKRDFFDMSKVGGSFVLWSCMTDLNIW